MALLVVPLKNHLATSDNPYYVHAEWSDTIEYDKLVEIMAGGRTTLTKPDITGCLELFTEEVMKLVADGKYVKTRLGAFYLCASGKLETPDQAFTPRRYVPGQMGQTRFSISVDSPMGIRNCLLDR